MRWRGTGLLATMALACVLAGASAGRAEDLFYKGKTLVILVGFGAGGGNDVYARLLAQNIGKYIPGFPSVVVENLPGEGSLTAVRQLDLPSMRDGTAVTTFQAGTIIQSLVSPNTVKIDFHHYSWVGVASGEMRVCYGYGDKGVNSWGELLKRKQFVLGTTSKGSASYVDAAMLRMFGVPIKTVLGYPGANEQRLAVQRGELDGDCGGTSSIPQDWLHSGLVHMFIKFSDTHESDVPDNVPYGRMLAKSDAQRQLFDMLTGTDQFGRVFIMCADAPPERRKILRQAFDATMKDKDFLAEAAKARLPIDPMTGVDAEKRVASLLATPPDIVAKAKEIYE